MVVVTKIS